MSESVQRDDRVEYTIREAATALKCTPTTVRNYIKQGKFPNARKKPGVYGDEWLIPSRDLQAAVQTIDVVPVPKAMNLETLTQALSDRVVDRVIEQMMVNQDVLAQQITNDVIEKVREENRELKQEMAELKELMARPLWKKILGMK